MILGAIGRPKYMRSFDHVKCPAGRGSNFWKLQDSEREISVCEPCLEREFSSSFGFGWCTPYAVDCNAQGRVVATAASNRGDAVCGA